MKRSRFGSVRKLPSGRWQARYTAPDGLMHKAPITYDSEDAAWTYLDGVRTDIVRDSWQTTKSRRSKLTFGEFADKWLDGRTVKGQPIRPRTRQHYRSLLDQHILPTFGKVSVRAITPELVDDWHERLGVSTPTLRSHSYALLRTILNTAVSRDIIAANPCRIRGAGQSRRVKRIRPATLPQLESIVANMPERFQAMTLMAAWCALRFGELTELRRNDVDLERGVIRVRRAVVRAGGRVIVGDPKSEAGVRDVSIPPHLLPALVQHVKQYAQPGPEGLLFPAADGESHLAPSTLYRPFYAARAAAGRPDLRWHDLRHTGSVLAAQTGATQAALMGRLGHSTAQASQRYQHAAEDADMRIAEALSALVAPPP